MLACTKISAKWTWFIAYIYAIWCPIMNALRSKVHVRLFLIHCTKFNQQIRTYFSPWINFNPHLQVSGPWMDHFTPISVYLRVIFLAPHTHVLCMGSGSATGFFLRWVSALFAKIFFFISVVILNSSLHYQIFKFDISIQIFCLDYW